MVHVVASFQHFIRPNSLLQQHRSNRLCNRPNSLFVRSFQQSASSRLTTDRRTHARTYVQTDGHTSDYLRAYTSWSHGRLELEGFYKQLACWLACSSNGGRLVQGQFDCMRTRTLSCSSKTPLRFLSVGLFGCCFFSFFPALMVAPHRLLPLTRSPIDCADTHLFVVWFQLRPRSAACPQ